MCTPLTDRLNVDRHYDHDPRNPDGPHTAPVLRVIDEQWTDARTYNLRNRRRLAGQIVAALLRAGIECSRSTSTTNERRTDVVLVAGEDREVADRVVATVVPRRQWERA